MNIFFFFLVEKPVNWSAPQATDTGLCSGRRICVQLGLSSGANKRTGKISDFDTASGI